MFLERQKPFQIASVETIFFDGVSFNKYFYSEKDV